MKTLWSYTWFDTDTREEDLKLYKIPWEEMLDELYWDNDMVGPEEKSTLFGCSHAWDIYYSNDDGKSWKKFNLDWITPTKWSKIIKFDGGVRKDYIKLVDCFVAEQKEKAGYC